MSGLVFRKLEDSSAVLEDDRWKIVLGVKEIGPQRRGNE